MVGRRRERNREVVRDNALGDVESGMLDEIMVEDIGSRRRRMRLGIDCRRYGTEDIAD